MKKIPFILSLAYRERIDQLCSVLPKMGLKYFVGYIVFNNGQTFVLSSMFHMLESYYAEGYYKEDFSFKREITDGMTHYLCDTTRSISELFQEVLESRFHIFRAYYIVRNCPECQFIFGAIKDTKIENHQYVYKSTLGNFEDFCCTFVDSTIDIIKKYNPTYSASLILNDKYYRRNIIKNNLFKDEKLTVREIDCLYWAANGKSSEETGVILGLSKATVDSYRNEAKKKLNASNITHAVFEAAKYGYLGCFGSGWERKDIVSINGMPILKSMHEAEKEMKIKQSNLWLLNQKFFERD